MLKEFVTNEPARPGQDEFHDVGLNGSRDSRMMRSYLDELGQDKVYSMYCLMVVTYGSH